MAQYLGYFTEHLAYHELEGKSATAIGDFRMRIPSSDRPDRFGANMTPMIDVVFLLIIFFLVSSHLARQENRLPLELPAAATPGPLDPDRSALTVSVDSEHRWRVAGEVISAERLRQILADHVERDGRSAAVRIRTDRSVPYGHVAPILSIAARTGIVDVSISVLREEA